MNAVTKSWRNRQSTNNGDGELRFNDDKEEGGWKGGGGGWGKEVGCHGGFAGEEKKLLLPLQWWEAKPHDGKGWSVAGVELPVAGLWLAQATHRS